MNYIYQGLRLNEIPFYKQAKKTLNGSINYKKKKKNVDQYIPFNTKRKKNIKNKINFTIALHLKIK